MNGWNSSLIIPSEKNSLYEQSLDETIRNFAFKMDTGEDDSESESSSLTDKASNEDNEKDEGSNRRLRLVYVIFVFGIIDGHLLGFMKCVIICR